MVCSTGILDLPVNSFLLSETWLGCVAGRGLLVYEQDWLHNEWEGLQCTLESATLSREWLLQMGNAAQANDLFIQYCMAYSRCVTGFSTQLLRSFDQFCIGRFRFALASVEIPAVDQIRVSDDYYVDLTHDHPRPVNAFIGTSSMLAAALGLAPSKDVFWSSSFEPGYPSKYSPHDPVHFPKVQHSFQFLLIFFPSTFAYLPFVCMAGVRLVTTTRRCLLPWQLSPLVQLVLVMELA